MKKCYEIDLLRLWQAGEETRRSRSWTGTCSGVHLIFPTSQIEPPRFHSHSFFASPQLASTRGPLEIAFGLAAVRWRLRGWWSWTSGIVWTNSSLRSPPTIIISESSLLARHRNSAMVCRSCWCLAIKLLLMDAQQYLSGAIIIIVSSWPSTDRTDSSVEGSAAPDCDYDSATKPWILWVQCLGGQYRWIQKLIRSCVFAGMCSLLMRMTIVAFDRGYRI